MKIAVITSQERCRRYTDPAMIPAGAELVFFDQGYTALEVLERAADARFILVDSVLPVTKEMIEGMPGLKMIQVEGVGYDRVDIEAAADRGVYVCNNRALNAGQVAEHTVLLILSVMRRLAEGEAAVRAGKQMEAKTRFMVEGLEDLVNKSVGIVGFGAIGRELAKRLLPFGCSLFYYDEFRASEEAEKQYAVTFLPFEELLGRSDIVTLHVPVTPSTRGMINRETLAMMKPNAILINCARGAVVNTADLAEAIRSGTIYGCGLDTIDPEPVPADDPVLLLPEPWRWRVAVSPHVAGTTRSLFCASYRNFWSSVDAVLRGGRPANVVNGL